MPVTGTIEDSVIHLVREHLLNTYGVPGATPDSGCAVGREQVWTFPRKGETNIKQINPQLENHNGLSLSQIVARQ